MPRGEFLAANLRNWDERVPIHRRDRTGFYAVERFLAGDKQLHAIELGELVDVAGKRLIHLQCHFRIDTLILARHCAIATGLDFSPAAIEEALLLAAARTYEWIHWVSRIIGALRGAGLCIDFVHEHPNLPWPPFPMCVRAEGGMWRLPDDIPAFPLSVSLRARKNRE